MTGKFLQTIYPINSSFQRIKPSAPLDVFIKCFWILEKKYTASVPYEVIYPDGCVDLVFKWENGQFTCFFVGPQTRSVRVRQSGNVTCFGIQFLPYGAFPFFAIPMNEFTGHICDPNDFLDTSFNEFIRRIPPYSVKNCIHDIEKFLTGRLLRGTLDLVQTMEAVKLIYQTTGSISICQLTDRVNLTRRTLERKFESVIGITPKELARIIRFNKVKNKLVQNPGTNLTSLSYEFQYFDQSHFIRDFKQITGLTPSVFAQEMAAH